MMKQKLLFAMLFIASALGMRAQTEFSGSVEAFPNTSWTPAYVSYDLSEVAAALGYEDAAAMAADLDAAFNGEAHTLKVENLDNNGVLKERDGITDAYYSRGTFGCFWLNADCEPVFYGDDNVFWTQIDWDLDEGELYVGIGQMAYLNGNTGCAPGDYTATDVLTRGSNTVTLVSTLKVVLPPDMPDPVTKIADLEIVDEAVVEVTQPVMNAWGENPYWSVDASKFIEATGANEGTVASNILKILNVRKWDGESDMMSDELFNGAFTANSGYWMLQSMSEDEGSTEKTDYCVMGNYGSSDFFIEYVTYNADAKEFYGWAGQMIQRFSGGEHFYTDIYFVYGNKALKVEFHFNVEKEADVALADMERVGGTSITWHQEPRTDYTGLKKWIPNLDEVCDLLGCNAADIKLKCVQSDLTLVSDYTTSNPPGFWIGSNGNVISDTEGVKCFYVEYAADKGAFTVGQNPGLFEDGDFFNADLLLCNKEKYYEVEVGLSIDVYEKVLPESDAQEVASYSFDLQTLIDNTWDVTQQTTETLDMEAVATLIGTEDYVVYAQHDGTWTTGYTCTPYPGFWFTPEGAVVGWSDAKIGMVFENNYIQAFKNPNAEVSVGDVFQHRIYLVNEKTGAYVTLNVNVTVVDKVVTYSTVGEADVAVEVKDSTSEGDGEMAFDLKTILNKFGADFDSFLESGYILPRINATQFAAPTQRYMEDGIMYDATGNLLSPDAEDYGIKIFVDMFDETTASLVVDTKSVDLSTAYSTDLMFQYESFRYILHVTLQGDEADGIAAFSLQPQSQGAVYNLGGQRVEAPTSGINIIGGKKVLVK